MRRRQTGRGHGEIEAANSIRLRAYGEPAAALAARTPALWRVLVEHLGGGAGGGIALSILAPYVVGQVELEVGMLAFLTAVTAVTVAVAILSRYLTEEREGEDIDGV